MKNNKGITLIALIITIIVMLILVGVSVTIALNGGLFDTANLAAKKTNKARLDEEIQAKANKMKMDVLADSSKYKVENYIEIFRVIYNMLTEMGFEIDSTYVVKDGDDNNMLDYQALIQKGYLNPDTLTPVIVSCKYQGKEYAVVIELEIGEDTTTTRIVNVSINTTSMIKIEVENEPVTVTVGENITSITEDGVPIPKGFYYVKGTKDTGVVISDSELDKNNTNGNNGNQFVWVPVKVNPKLKIEVESNKLISEIRILNIDGYDDTIEVNNFFFKKIINLDHNDAYEVIVKYEDGTEESVLKEVNIVYETINEVYGFAKIYSYLSGTSIDETIETFKTLFLENDPTLVFDNRIEVLRVLASKEEFIDEYHIDDASESPNVLKYGGFYIGRYEASSYGIKKDKMPVHTIKYEDAKTSISNLYTNKDEFGVTSDLPSGAAWDWLGNWLIITRAKTSYEIYADSTGWGNFRKYINNKDYSLKVTGDEEQYRANNIYDLVGNIAEWTKEVGIEKTKDATTGEEIRGNIARGESYTGYTWSTFSNKELFTEADKTVGGRPMLYIND